MKPFVVSRDQEPKAICTSEVLPRVLNGQLVVFRNDLQRLDILSALHRLIIASVKKVCGEKKAGVLQQLGIPKIHEVLSPNLLLGVYIEVRHRLYATMPFITARMVRSLTNSDFNVHLSSLIRFLVPQRYLINSRKLFKKHLGKLWPHGPHHDYFQNVPVNAVNLWMAVEDVSKDNGMAVYTDCWNKSLPLGDSIVRNDQYLGRPYLVECNKGDVLIFHSHHMHSAVVNTSLNTRVVLTNRFCVGKPEYPNPDRPQLYTPASELLKETRPFETLLSDYSDSPPDYHLIDRDVTLGAEIKNPQNRTKRSVLGWDKKNADDLEEGEITALDKRWCAARVNGSVVTFARRCTHEGADLALGYCRNGRIYCPWHALSFDPKTGMSTCDRIKPLKVQKALLGRWW